MSAWKIEKQVDYHVYYGDDFRGDFETEAEAEAFVKGFEAGTTYGRAVQIKRYESGEWAPEATESSPEQPSHKHPEKDIFNLSEDEGWDVSAEADEGLPTAEDVCGILAEDRTETNESDPITPMADLSATQVHKDDLRAFAGDGRDWATSQDGPLIAPANGQAQE